MISSASKVSWTPMLVSVRGVYEEEKTMNYREVIESRMDKLLDKKNELVDKYFADGRISTHTEIRTLQLLDMKYQEYTQLLIDFFTPGQTEEDDEHTRYWEKILY